MRWFFRLWLGARLFVVSAIVGVVGALPLWIAIAFGPKDGNALGFGLLATLSAPVASVGMAIGGLATMLQFLAGDRS